LTVDKQKHLVVDALRDFFALHGVQYAAWAGNSSDETAEVRAGKSSTG
jgi:hypothetical protein